MQKRNVYVFVALLVTMVTLGIAQTMFERAAAQNGAPQAPRFEVDPMWPKPLPNGWLIGSTIGIWVDAQDHVWIIHRPDTFTARTEIGTGTNPPTAELCCKAAPPVLEFDAAGNLVNSWGGKGDGYSWPESNHGITVDAKGNVWIGGNGQGDSHILKFSRDGKFLAQYGKPGVRSVPVAAGEKPQYKGDSNDQQNFGRVAKIFIDNKASEAYLADGYLNKRVAVVDMESGKMKRFWGAYGAKPDDTNMGLYNPEAPPIKQFRNPVHCADVSNDGLVYVCDRPNNRLQVFKTDGTFVKEEFYFKKTLGDGAVWDVAFSKDPQQKYLYLADGKNERVHILDRQSLQLLTSFGDGGRQPGQFFAVHSIATDTQGNLYTTETYEGKRVQKFVYKGVGPVTKKDQGVLWPARQTSSR